MLLPALLIACVPAQSPAASGAAPAAVRANEDSARVVLEKIDLRDIPLSEACRLLADQSGLNLVPSAGASTVKVTLYLRDAEALDAIDALCRAHSLWYQRDAESGVVRIHTVDEYQRDLSSLQRERLEAFTLLYPNALDVGFAIRNLFGDRVELHADDSDRELLLDLNDRFSRFDLIDRRTQGLGSGTNNGVNNGTYGNNVYGQSGGLDGGYGVGLNALSPGSTNGARSLGAYGAPDIELNPLTRSARDAGLTPEEIQRLAGTGLPTRGDVESNAALIRSLSHRLGAPIHVSVARRQNKLLVRTADEGALEEIQDLVKRLDVPTALVLLEVRVLAIDLTDGMSSFFEYQSANGNTAGGFALGGIQAPTPPTLGPAGTGLRAGDLVFQFVDQHFAARMQLLERDNRVRSISSPVLLTANNEVSRLFVGREVPLNRGFTGGQVVANQTTTSTVTGSTAIEFRPVGTTLLITPNINADRTVTLRIVQETSNTDTTANVLVPSEDGFVSQNVPVVSSQSVSGTIVAKSELAVVFGGLIEEGVRREKEQVPILGDVPLIGVLFQRKNDVKTRRELVVMVRPYVLGTPSESEEASRKLLQSLGGDLDELQRAVGEGAKDSRNERTTRFRVHGVDEEPR